MSDKRKKNKGFAPYEEDEIESKGYYTRLTKSEKEKKIQQARKDKQKTRYRDSWENN